MVLWNALRSGTGFIEENLLLKRVKDLSHANIKSIGDIYRLNEEKGLVKTEKENISREKSIMQKTVDGKNAEIKTLKIPGSYYDCILRIRLRSRILLFEEKIFNVLKYKLPYYSIELLFLENG